MDRKTLLNVLHVPKLHTNLFSQGRVTDKGNVLVCDNEKCEFKNKNRGDTVAMGIRNNGLYKMLIRKNHIDDAQMASKTSGHCTTLGGSILSWCSQRQDSVSMSTAEAEYRSGSDAIRELVWMVRLLNQFIGSFTPILLIVKLLITKAQSN